MEDCIFCKLVKGKIPCNKVGESENFISFLDLHPKNKGHILIISKEHYPDLRGLPEGLGNELIHFSKELLKKVSKATSASDFKFLINSGEKAGQVIFHAHFHLIPYYKTGIASHPQLSDKETARLAEAIRDQ
ncbi:HIT family protein [Candidatus Woesearchaeota archaeon]|nr:HIT family protein [Candidatus Woesearchaeota archaeon]